MAANPEIFLEHDRLGRPLAWSVGLHIGVTVFAIVYAYVAGRPGGTSWGAGGGGDAIGATLVSSVPLPAKTAQTDNILAREPKVCNGSNLEKLTQERARDLGIQEYIALTTPCNRTGAAARA